MAFLHCLKRPPLKSSLQVDNAEKTKTSLLIDLRDVVKDMIGETKRMASKYRWLQKEVLLLLSNKGTGCHVPIKRKNNKVCVNACRSNSSPHRLPASALDTRVLQVELVLPLLAPHPKNSKLIMWLP